MKIYTTLISFAFFLQIFAQSQPYNQSWTKVFAVLEQKIQLTCIFEGVIETESGPQNSYTLSWEDTIGNQKFEPHNRPYELKVVIRDEKKIVGQYTGLSTQFRHCSIVTNSDEVAVFFWIDRNLFYQAPQSVSVDNRKSLEGYVIMAPRVISILDFNYFRKEYAPLNIRLKHDAQNVVDGLKQKEILLVGNPNIVTLHYINKGALNPDPMPRLSPSYSNIIPRNRYLLNTKNGEIKKGKNWLFWRGIRYCSHIDFRVVDPQKSYTARDGQTFLGKEIIQKKRLPKTVDPEIFQSLANSLPY
jgi:hypothetical protein